MSMQTYLALRKFIYLFKELFLNFKEPCFRRNKIDDEKKDFDLNILWCWNYLQGHFWNAAKRGRNNNLLYSSWALVSEKLNAEEKYILLYILEVRLK